MLAIDVLYVVLVKSSDGIDRPYGIFTDKTKAKQLVDSNDRFRLSECWYNEIEASGIGE